MDGMFSGLSGLMKGLEGIVPQDNPEIKLLNAKTEITDLKKQEQDIYTEIGRLAYSRSRGEFPEQESRLKLIEENIRQSENKLKQLEAEKNKEDMAKQEARDQTTCSSCGFENQEGVKFCQQCGAQLGVKKFCPGCGQPLVAGIKFCGGCGARVEA